MLLARVKEINRHEQDKLFAAKRTRAPPPDLRFVVRMLNTHLAFDSCCINVNHHTTCSIV